MTAPDLDTAGWMKRICVLLRTHSRDIAIVYPSPGPSAPARVHTSNRSDDPVPTVCPRKRMLHHPSDCNALYLKRIARIECYVP